MQDTPTGDGLHNVEFERRALGAALRFPEACEQVVHRLGVDDFYTVAHKALYEVIRDRQMNSQTLDAPLVLQDLARTQRVENADAVLATIWEDAGYPSATSEYISGIRACTQARKLADLGSRFRATAMGTDGDPDAVAGMLLEADSAIRDLTEASSDTQWEPIHDLAEKVAEGGGRMDPHFTSGFPDMDRILQGGFRPGQLVVIAARPGQGKALALDTLLPTPTGWTTMGEVAVGDSLIGMDGNPTTVVGATGVMEDRPCYEIVFSDGTTMIADAEHQWFANDRAMRKRGAVDTYKVVTTAEMAQSVTVGADQRKNWRLPPTPALNLPESDLPVAPYTFGAWIGDGATGCNRFSTADQDILDAIRAEGHSVRKVAGAYTYSITREAADDSTVGTRVCTTCRGFKPNYDARQCAQCRRQQTLTGRLRMTGALARKHIPSIYLRGSIEQRHSLLAGLLDTDGTVSVTRTHGAAQFAVTNAQVASGFHEVARSLGYKASTHTRRVAGKTEESSTCYVETFSTNDDVFRLPRKRDRHAQTRSATRRGNERYIASIRRVASVPVRCVQVDNADHSYLAGESMIPTHNSTLSVDISRSASLKQGVPGLHLSLEMSGLEIAARLMSAEAGVPLTNIQRNEISEDDAERLEDVVERIERSPFYVVDEIEPTLPAVVSVINAAHRRLGIKFATVDYAQLITSDGTAGTPREQVVANVSRTLKGVARALGITIFLVAQLNRGPEQRTGNRPMVSDLRESGQIEQDADIIILIYQDQTYNPATDRGPEADIIFGKHRNGPLGTVVTHFQGHYARFVNAAAEPSDGFGGSAEGATWTSSSPVS